MSRNRPAPPVLAGVKRMASLTANDMDLETTATASIDMAAHEPLHDDGTRKAYNIASMTAATNGLPAMARGNGTVGRCCH